MAYVYESKLYANSVVHSITENVFIETGETKEIKEVYRKAKAWDEIVEYKHNIMAVKEISLTHATDEPINTDMYSVHSLVDNLLDVIEELERADDD